MPDTRIPTRPIPTYTPTVHRTPAPAVPWFQLGVGVLFVMALAVLTQYAGLWHT